MILKFFSKEVGYDSSDGVAVAYYFNFSNSQPLNLLWTFNVVV